MHDPDTHQRNKTYGADEVNRFVDWRIEVGNGIGAAIIEMPEIIQAARGGDDRAFNYLIDHYQAAAQTFGAPNITHRRGCG